MMNPELADLSRTLFFPWTFVLYAAAMAAYFFRLAFTQVDRPAGDRGRVGLVVGRLGIVLAGAGLVTHLGSIVTRSRAGRRPPPGGPGGGEKEGGG
jgi:hypothetical protein